MDRISTIASVLGLAVLATPALQVSAGSDTARVISGSPKLRAFNGCELLVNSGGITDANTVWIGLVSDFTNRPIRRLAADVARREIASVAKGLPPIRSGGARRPLGLVACNSAAGIDSIFYYLIGKLKLPAVIGPDKSGEALHALTTYTLAAGTVVVGNNTTADEFTTLPTRGLFVRLLASDAWQGKADALFIGTRLEPQLRAKGLIAAGDAMRLLVVHKGDAYGRGIADILIRNLRFNGKSATDNGSNFKRIDYGNPDDTTSAQAQKYGAVAADIISMRPHVIAFAGTTEMLDIVKAVESGWPVTASYRPIWMGTDGAGVISARSAVNDSTFPKRLLATNLKLDFDRPVARNLLETMAAERPEVFRKDPRSATALATYDAVYAIAYAIASLRSTPLTGSNIAIALRAMNQQGAPDAEVGPVHLREILSRLAKGERINLRGTTGDLDWDAQGDVMQDIEILCVRLSPPDRAVSVPTGMKPSGLYFDVRRNAFSGEIRGCP